MSQHTSQETPVAGYFCYGWYTAQGTIRFPPDSGGFLYFHCNPRVPVLAGGEIRFRVTNDPSPSSFPDGRDLLDPEDKTWRIPLLNTGKKSYSALQSVLLHDGFITPSLLEACEKVWGSSTELSSFTRKRSRLLYSLGQTFYFELASNFSLWFVRHAPEAISCISLMVDGRNKFGVRNPYVGSVECCFERSPFPQHTDRRILVMRVVKITDPVKCVVPGYDNHIPAPVEGDLLRGPGGKPRMWDLDHTIRFAPLRQLLE